MERGHRRYITCLAGPTSLNEFIDYIGFGMFSLKLFFAIGFLTFVNGIALSYGVLISPAFSYNWDLEPMQLTYIHLPFFVGVAAGAVYWGWLADIHGRKKIAIASTAMVAYFVVFSAGSVNAFGYIIGLVFVGFGVSGGIIIAPCYLAELNAVKHRGRVIVAVEFFHVLGTLFSIVVGYFSINTLGWRHHILLSIFPFTICFLMFCWLPESVQYLRNTSKYHEIMTIIHYISNETKTVLPKNFNIECERSSKCGFVSLLFKSQYNLKLTLMAILSITSTTSLYAASRLVANLYSKLSMSNTEGKKCSVLEKDYFLYTYSLLGETLACLLILLLLEIIGRKRCLIGMFSIIGVCYLALAFNIPRMIAMVLMFTLRGFSSAAIHFIYLYATELFPTVTRGSALGICVSTSGLAMIPILFIIDISLTTSITAVGYIFGGLAFLSALVVLLLPETTGQPLLNT